MKLEKFLRKHISPYQHFQLKDAQSGECFTSVTYLDGGSEGDEIDLHRDDVVHGVSAGICKNKWDGTPLKEEEQFTYVIITLDQQFC